LLSAVRRTSIRRLLIQKFKKYGPGGTASDTNCGERAALSTNRGGDILEVKAEDTREQGMLSGRALVDLLAALDGTSVAVATFSGDGGGDDESSHSGEESDFGEHFR
jgi:hypothetical protein